MLQLGTYSGDQYVIDTRDFDLKELKPLLENPNITFVLHNVKFDYNMLKRYDIILNNVYDTMVVDQIIYNGIYNMREIVNSKRFSLAGVYKHYFDIEIEKETRNEFSTIKKKPFTWKQILYGSKDVVYPLQIKKKQEDLISKYELEVTVRLENQVALVLADMEYNGFKIDLTKLRDIIQRFKTYKQESIQQLDAYLINKDPKYRKQGFQLSLFGDHDTKQTHVNWSSDQQVLSILKDTFGINATDKYGKDSAGKDALEQLDEESYDPIVKMILKYRKEDKIVSSFGEEYINKYLDIDDRLHTSYNQIVATGRLSSRDPNLQQVPSDKEYRSCFVAEKGNKLICADYSSQESRIMADFANDTAYIDFFVKDGGDPHSYIATKMFSTAFGREFIVTKDNENKAYRQKGKTLNFGISFGMSPPALAKRLHITEKEAKELIDLFYETFPSLNTLFSSAREFGSTNGYIRTNDIIKRIRWFPTKKELDLSKTKSERSKIQGRIERQSQNSIIQGSAADMTKIALVILRKKLLSEGIRPTLNAKVKILAAVHDEIIIETTEELAEKYANYLGDSMKEAGKVICKKVPMEADVKIADFWIH